MGKLKQVKSKDDKVKEGIYLLKQLRDNGVKDYSFGFIDLKTKISEWISGDIGWQGNIDFSEYGRLAEVDLPKYDNRSAGINFKIKKSF